MKNNAAYRLARWTLRRGERLVEVMENYPDAVYLEDRREGNAAYYALFDFAILAESEALLRSPNASQAQAWWWMRGYNLARMGDPEAGTYYADLILSALNQGEVTPEDLNVWFFDHEPRMALRPVELEPVQGSLATYLIELRAAGSAYLLLLEMPGEFQVHVLTSAFNFISPRDYDFLVSDLTGDGLAEVTIFPVQISLVPENPLPQVFDLSVVPPRSLDFAPGSTFPIGLDHRAAWQEATTLEGKTDLVFTTHAFPACPAVISHRYHWSGQWFELVESQYRLEPDRSLLAFCDPLFKHALGTWGTEVTAKFLRTGITLAEESSTAGEQIAAALLDEWRYLLGVSAALAGNRADAVGTLLELKDQPSAPTSRFPGLADEFLSHYRAEGDIYRACVASPACDPSLALGRLIADAPLEEEPAIVSRLSAAGVPIRQTGDFDFEADGRNERWLTVRHPGHLDLEFWVLVQGPGRMVGLLVDTLNAADPRLSGFTTLDGRTVFEYAGGRAAILDRLPGSRIPYVSPYQPELALTSVRVQNQIRTALENLLAGANPAQIRDELLALRDSPIFGCTYATCPDFIYPLALAFELAGDERDAVDQYLELWRVYPRSPYTLLARLKLSGEALLPTSTPTLTPTITLTPTLTLTVTGTPPTPTQTQSGTPATPTNTPTPSPSPTASATPTP